jgi:hypothetical protein
MLTRKKGAIKRIVLSSRSDTLAGCIHALKFASTSGAMRVHPSPLTSHARLRFIMGVFTPP